MGTAPLPLNDEYELYRLVYRPKDETKATAFWEKAFKHLQEEGCPVSQASCNIQRMSGRFSQVRDVWHYHNCTLTLGHGFYYEQEICDAVEFLGKEKVKPTLDHFIEAMGHDRSCYRIRKVL